MANLDVLKTFRMSELHLHKLILLSKIIGENRNKTFCLIVDYLHREVTKNPELVEDIKKGG